MGEKKGGSRLWEVGMGFGGSVVWLKEILKVFSDKTSVSMASKTSTDAELLHL